MNFCPREFNNSKIFDVSTHDLPNHEKSHPKGNDGSPESQHAQKGFFFFNNLGQDAQNKYA